MISQPDLILYSVSRTHEVHIIVSLLALSSWLLLNPCSLLPAPCSLLPKT
ncbi:MULTISPECIES: hypothetical protein [Moorena]|nr:MULTISPECIES: hypothetical protein [Moorena]NEO75185.1 hypothetical protein [Moorena sp. SIO4G3]